jgi:hypothetical protein
MSSKNRSRSLTAVTVLAAAVIAAGFTALDIVPAASQDTLLRAWAIDSNEALMDPWSQSWSDIKPSIVALSAQNATKPLGGGEVATLKARALQDGSNLYVLLEWSDKTRDETVNGQTVFADSAAIELPVAAGVAVPSFCMGDPTGTVNIWHWKAVWQADIDSGFTSVRQRYPDGFADDYLLDDDPVFQTARAAGNLLAQTTHASPVENLVAANFGTLTTADLQDIDGKGAWKDGRWRVLFARPLRTSSGYPSLAEGDSTNMAFAVWDGSKGNRDGIKSVSQFTNLIVSASQAPQAGGGFPWWGWVIAAAIVLTFGLSAAAALYRQGGRGPL